MSERSPDEPAFDTLGSTMLGNRHRPADLGDPGWWNHPDYLAQQDREADAYGTDDDPGELRPGSQNHGQNGQYPGSQQPVKGSGHFGHVNGEPWNDEPIPLGYRPGPLPTVDDVLGPVLGPLTRAIAESYQVPADLVVNLALPIITTAVAGRRTVQITDDWSETIALASLSALASGERKSPVQRALVQPLADHERAARAEARPRIARQQAERTIAEARAEKLRKDAARGKDKDDEAVEQYATACAELTALTVDAAPRWLVDDITPEAIAQRLAEHGAVGAVSAEPGLFAVLAGRYNNGAPNVENVLKATSGDPITVDRVSREPIHVDKPALSVSMCIQPARLSELGGRGSVFRGSGLLARLLYVLPEPRVGTRSTSTEPVPGHVLSSWSERLAALAGAAELPPVLTVDSEASEQLDAFRARLEPRLHPHHGNLAGVADWGSKLPGTVVRIAAALTLLSDPSRSGIDEPTMAAAIKLGEAYIGHAQAAFAAIHSADDSRAHAREVLGWLCKHGRSYVSLRDIHRALRGRAWIEKADDLRAPVAILIDHGHLRPAADDRESGQPGRPSERYALHPSHLAAGVGTSLDTHHHRQAPDQRERRPHGRSPGR